MIAVLKHESTRTLNLWNGNHSIPHTTNHLHLCLFIISNFFIRAVVSSLYPDVMNALTAAGSTAAQLSPKQRLDLLQTQTLGLRQTAHHKHKAQQSQTGVQEERTWTKETFTLKYI